MKRIERMKRGPRLARFLAGAALAAGALGGAWAGEPAVCGAVRMAAPGWTDIEATNALAGVVLKALGYRQSVSNLSVPITYQGLKKGQIDVFLGNWMPAQAPLVKPFVDARAIDVLGANLSGAKFTLAVPDYVAAAGVRQFADLARQADRFGARIYGIEPGAPANQSIRRMLDDHALGPARWSLVESSETGMLTQVERAVRAHEWIVFLAWEPHLMNTRFHLVYLAGGDAYFGPDYGSATVNTVTRAGFAADCPNLARLFRQMRFGVDLENRLIARLLDPHQPAEAAARQALRDEPARVAAWLDGVTTANGAPGLPAVRAALAGP
ncbi:choline ABC transporter substrate-binding protein [Burkholderia sp. FERM BP-3421]|jgi:glycine betaine/proline transport system substrate-binding protein|uniref:choline ABC transporter substrate-binding protein n=1 Tax=Burkholderia sp. FERM BP-3421 TaxID=1494466 RepID=UPI0023626D46|nr:choline ABC transporter substrate-binding protein [Burkholderia sp. FERM BP-3421]WDD91600.1 choline ABC transporter substrate-binding protein [Burkholderia sp. FERM BP-3421]